MLGIGEAATTVINGASGQNFSGIDFSNSIFQGVFIDCIFASTDLRGAIFEKGTSFINCDFSGALAQGTPLLKYAISSIGVKESISSSASIDNTAVINSLALVTTNAVVNELPKTHPFLMPLAATVLGGFAAYGLFKLNQHYVNKVPIALHEYSQLVDAEEKKGASRKRKEPAANENGEVLANQANPKRRKLNIELPENWRELLGADGMDRPKRKTAETARQKIQNIYRSRS